MHLILKSLTKSKTGTPASPVYTATFEIDGRVVRAHAVVRTRQGNATRFIEPTINELLMNNMDEGRKVFAAIMNKHRGVALSRPIPLGEMLPFAQSRPASTHRKVAVAI